MSGDGERPNIFEPTWERELDQEPFGLKGARIGAAAGSSRVGLSVQEIPPGRRNLPYHAHHGIEELIIVLRGEPLLRTPAGERRLAEGEVVACPPGPEGAHQLINDGTEPLRVAIASSKADADFIVYPDSNKLSAQSGEWGTPDAFSAILPLDEEREYFDGELD